MLNNRAMPPFANTDVLSPNSAPKFNKECKGKKLLAVDFEVLGHHPAYIQNIATVWAESNFEHSIEFLLTNKFREVQQSTIAQIEDLSDERVTLRFVSEAEERLLANPKTKYWNGWKIYCRYADERRASHGLLMFMDPFQLSICLGKESPIPFSGIYFRPTFHYGLFKGYHQTTRDRLVSYRKAFLLRRVLKNKQLRNLLSVDGTAVPYIQSHFPTGAHISHFPDSFPRTITSDETIEQRRATLGIEPARKVFCLIGVLDSRKGPLQLLEAIQHIPDSIATTICVLLVGRTADELRAQITDAIAKIKIYSKVQVILQDSYITPSEVLSYYALSDVMLTTYQFHKGSSSALIHAAHAKKPVLSSDFGWIGHMVRTYSLGIDIDSSAPSEIAKGIVRFATTDPTKFINANLASQLDEANSQKILAKALASLMTTMPQNVNSLEENTSRPLEV